jgi:hypothetical protein
MPKNRLVLAESFQLLPPLVRPHVSDPRHAVWLVPTPSFRRAAFTRRDPADAFWLRTTNPDRALANPLERDRIVTGVIAGDAARNGLKALYVDGTRAIDDMTESSAAHFGLLR